MRNTFAKSIKFLVGLLPVLTLLVIGSLGFSSVRSVPETITDTATYYEPLYSEPTELDKFIHKVGNRESGNNPRVVNQFGMMGKYQFSRTTLRLIRPSVSREEFLKNSHLQDTVMIEYLKINKRELSKYIKKYDGKTVKGIKVTLSGILAAAHLGGAGSVIEWLTNSDSVGLTDANGTSITHYMKDFSGYNIGKYL